MNSNLRISQLAFLLSALSLGVEAGAQDAQPNSESDRAILVEAIEDARIRQSRALSDAVEAYGEIAAYWHAANKCDLQHLCADERYSIQIMDANVQLLYAPSNDASVKLASFPIKAVHASDLSKYPLPALGTIEYSYVKLQRSMSIISRQAAIERLMLYRFPDAQDNPFLPWPPKAPSAYEDVTSSFTTTTTLGGIAEQIRKRVALKGYDTLRYFSVPGGFAVATDLERVGRRRAVADADRWTVGKRGGIGSLFDYWRRLLAGEDDRFRVFVFIVTEGDIRNDSEMADGDDLRRWKTTGRPSLSRQRASATALSGTRIWLYAYEFQASRSKEAKLIQNDRDALRIGEFKKALGLP